MKRTKPVLFGVVLLAIVSGVAAIALFRGGPQPHETLQTVRMGSFSVAIDYAPYLVAKEKRWFEEALKDDGIAVEYTTFQSLPPINESFATDRVDVVFEAEVPAIVGRAAGIGLEIAAMSSTLSAEDFITRPGGGVGSLADLKGKKVAVLTGTGYHYALLNSLDAIGLSRKDVNILDMMPPDAKAAFESGAIDAWAVWPPWPEQELLAGKAESVPGLNAKVQVIMVTRKDFATKHRQVLGEVVGVVERAKKWIGENPKEAQEIVSKSLELPIEVVEAAWPKNNFSAQLTPAVIADMQSKADFLKIEGYVKEKVNVQSEMISGPGSETRPNVDAR